jgi:hypothetical protein
MFQHFFQFILNIDFYVIGFKQSKQRVLYWQK